MIRGGVDWAERVLTPRWTTSNKRTHTYIYRWKRKRKRTRDIEVITKEKIVLVDISRYQYITTKGKNDQLGKGAACAETNCKS